MAFTGSALCNSWKKEIFAGVHVHALSGGDTFKAAIYDNTATWTKATTAYSFIAAERAFPAGGVAINNVDAVLSGDTAYITWGNAIWGAPNTFTTYGALVYNSSKSNRAVLVIDFGGAKVVTTGSFTLQWPTAGASTAVIRLT